MNDDILTPWYALEVDTSKQRVFNRPRSAVKVNKPVPKPSKPAVVYRSAMEVIMELTVKIRKDLDGSVPFDWPDDYYAPLCVSWYEEQKKKGISDIVFLCGEECSRATGKFYECCMVCWYADGNEACFIPSQEKKGGDSVPVITEVELANRNYPKPVFVDNAKSFKCALLAISEYASHGGWKRTFKEGISIMEQDNVVYHGQKDTFSIPQPYFKYLLAAQVTQLYVGMGSWYDQYLMGTEGFKVVTKRFSNERHKALMYAINNC